MGVSASTTKTPSTASNGGENAAVSSERLQIHGQNDLFGKVKISRTMPAVLTNRMTHFAWTNFCDAVDASLLPASMLKTQAFFAFVLLFAVSIGQLFLKDTDFPRFPIWIVQFVLIAVLVFVGRYGKLKIDQGLRKVCEDISAVHPGIVFQAKRIRSRSSQLYIEVCVSTDLQMTAPTTGHHGNLEMPLAAPSLTLASLYSPTTDNDNPALSPEYVPGPAMPFVVTREERLRELDQIKGLLTENEYEAKRAEILAEI